MIPGAAFAATAAAAGGFTPLGDVYSIAAGGVNTYALVGKPADMDFDWDADDFSAMAWVYVSSTANFQCVLSKAYANSANMAVFVGITNAGAPYLYIGNASVAGSNGSITAGNWYLIGFTASGGVGKLFVNGSQVGSDLTIGANGSNADWIIGASRYNDADDVTEAFPFNGYIHNVAFWNVAVAPGNVTAYYNGGIPVNAATYFSTGLIHHYRMGNHANDFTTTAYRIADTAGSQHATLTNYGSYGAGALWLVSPGSSANSYAYLPTNVFSALYQYRAADFVHQDDWVANFGAYTAAYTAGAGDSVQGDSSFSGIKEVTVGDIFLMPADAVHGVSNSTAVTYAMVMYTGALDGSGGFFAGSDDNGTNLAHVRLFNHFYTKDIGARVYNDAGADNELAGLNAVHTNKYVMIHVTVDVPNTSVKTYVNGIQVNSGSLAGTFTGVSSLGFGIMSVWKTGGSHYESTAAGQKFIEFTRYDSVLTPKQIAAQAAAWNTIKGYV